LALILPEAKGEIQITFLPSGGTMFAAVPDYFAEFSVDAG